MASQYTFNGISLDDPGGRWSVGREWYLPQGGPGLRPWCLLTRGMAGMLRKWLLWRLSRVTCWMCRMVSWWTRCGLCVLGRMGRASSVLRVGCGLARTMCDRRLWWRLSTT